jgi:L-ribulose-5-phosphate 3-epimerase
LIEFIDRVGVMQGRLLPETSRGYQACPTENWNEEFRLAQSRKLSHVEWVLDEPFDLNPLVSDFPEVERASRAHIQILSVCADFVMQTEWDPRVIKEKFRKVSDSVSALGVKFLVIPFVDSTSLKNSVVRLPAAEALVLEITELFRGSGVQLSLETDLDPDSFAQFMEKFQDLPVGVNYDIGNSASMGYSFMEELEAYLSRINLVHVKDRLLMGPSVKLGSGDADIPGVIRALEAGSYSGLFTMQAFRDFSGLEVFDEQLTWLKSAVG